MSVSFISALIRMRVMPLTITMLSLLLCIKVYDLAMGTNELSRALIAGEAIAVPSEPAEETETAQTPPAEDAAEDSADGDIIASKQEDSLPAPGDKRQFSQIELDILQSLSARREKLEQWEEEVRMKENLLEATEVRISKRIEEIETLEKNVRELLEQYEKQEESNIRSLVKIYESMKPKEAARIFDEVEMPVLLMVVDRMKERKAAPILAKMNPLKAKALTVELAEERKLLEGNRVQ